MYAKRSVSQRFGRYISMLFSEEFATIYYNTNDQVNRDKTAIKQR